jgi:hypothetical protein
MSSGRPIDRARHADREPRPRERVPPDHLLGQAEFAAHVPHLVLEQLPERFDEGELHVLLQAAHVVVRLDRRRRPALRAHRLDHVGVERALHQEGGVLAGLRGRVLEDVDERVADDLPLPLRLVDAGEPVEEAVLRIDTVTSCTPRCCLKVRSTCSRS